MVGEKAGLSRKERTNKRCSAIHQSVNNGGRHVISGARIAWSAAMSALASGSDATLSETRRQALRTVAWLRPPKARPIVASESWVRSRQSCIARWRGHATVAALLEEASAAGGREK